MNTLIQSLEKPEKNIFIYGLLDPDTNELRYIGQTIQGFSRIREHFYKCNNINKLTNCYSASKYWIQKLKKENKIFKIIYLEYFDEISSKIDESEKFWISYFIMIGCRLLNHELGGKRSNYDFKNYQNISQKTIEAMNNPIIKEKCRKNALKTGNLRRKSPLKQSTKEKISKAQDNKVIYIKDQNNNIYRGLKEAAKALDVTFGTIWKALNGYCKTVKGQTLMRVN